MGSLRVAPWWLLFCSGSDLECYAAFSHASWVCDSFCICLFFTTLIILRVLVSYFRRWPLLWVCVVLSQDRTWCVVWGKNTTEVKHPLYHIILGSLASISLMMLKLITLLKKTKAISINFPHFRNLTTFPSYTVFGTSESANIVDTLKNIFFFLIKDTGPMLRLFCGHWHVCQSYGTELNWQGLWKKN